MAVRAEYAPPLTQLEPRWISRAVIALLAVVAVFAVVRAIQPDETGIDVVRTSPLPFNFRYPPELTEVRPKAGELVRLERRRDGLFIQAFAVAPLELPPYEGEVLGFLPAWATSEIERLSGLYDEFEFVEESPARVNEAGGYEIVFRARLDGRRLYGREVVLPEPKPGTRRGVRLILESTPAAGVGRAEDVGVRGFNKRPYRSFRFGTERP